MFKKITIALLASSLLSAPVFAQSTMRAQSGAPATAITIKHAKSASTKAHVVKVKKHKAKKIKIAKHKHAKHVVIAKHSKHIATTKPTTPAHHN